MCDAKRYRAEDRSNNRGRTCTTPNTGLPVEGIAWGTPNRGAKKKLPTLESRCLTGAFRLGFFRGDLGQRLLLLKILESIQYWDLAGELLHDFQQRTELKKEQEDG